MNVFLKSVFILLKSCEKLWWIVRSFSSLNKLCLHLFYVALQSTENEADSVRYPTALFQSSFLTTCDALPLDSETDTMKTQMKQWVNAVSRTIRQKEHLSLHYSLKSTWQPKSNSSHSRCQLRDSWIYFVLPNLNHSCILVLRRHRFWLFLVLPSLGRNKAEHPSLFLNSKISKFGNWRLMELQIILKRYNFYGNNIFGQYNVW